RRSPCLRCAAWRLRTRFHRIPQRHRALRALCGTRRADHRLLRNRTMHSSKISLSSDIDLALSLVSAAAMAPSSHNTQPWLFLVGHHSIDLVADRRRALPVNDPGDRELTISCGCALLNLRVAAAAAGYSPRVALCPEP